MKLFFKAKNVRFANSKNRYIPTVLTSETHYLHAFTNIATAYGKRMDEIDANVKQQ